MCRRLHVVLEAAYKRQMSFPKISSVYSIQKHVAFKALSSESLRCCAMRWAGRTRDFPWLPQAMMQGWSRYTLLLSRQQRRNLCHLVLNFSTSRKRLPRNYYDLTYLASGIRPASMEILNHLWKMAHGCVDSIQIQWDFHKHALQLRGRHWQMFSCMLCTWKARS